jgi:hypothetical protein
MKNSSASVWRILGGVLATGLLAATGLVGAARAPMESAPVADELGRRWRGVEQAGDRLSVRSVFSFALEAAAAGWRPDLVERAMEIAAPLQDRDPQSKTYGNFRWYASNPQVQDRNAVEFCMQSGAVLRLKYWDRLTPGAQRRFDEMARLGIEGMARHQVAPAYTNIFLMKTWNRIALGEALNRPSVAAEGYAMLAEWLRFTAQNGIVEYNSPNYYGPDIESLGLIARFALRPAGRAHAATALRLFWSDIAANWYAPAERLGGANSRCYQYLDGRGHLDNYLFAEGWQTEGKAPVLGAFLDACRWTPPAALTEPLRAAVPRTVVQRWGTDPWQRAVHYVGREFSLGSSGMRYNSDDRVLVLNLGRSARVPQTIFFMDGRGDPYGTNKTPDRNTHAKALHLMPFVAAVQRGAEVVQVLADDLAKPDRRRPGDKFTGLWTQLPIPAAADVWFGDTPAQPGSPAAPALVPAGAPVFMRLGGVTAGMRFLFTEAMDGKPAPVRFVRDDPKLPANRLTVVHAEGTDQGRGITAVWLRVADGLDDAGFTAFRREFATAKADATHKGDTLSLEAAGRQGLIRIEADLAKGERRRLEGGEPGAEAALLLVNGRDVGRELLREWLPQ